METELKLLINPEDAENLRNHPLLRQYAISAPREQTLSGIYYDTRNHDLRQADAGLRVRQVDQDWVQTLKAGGTVVAGLHERNEWESRLAGPEPDLGALRRQIDPKSGFAKFIKGLHKRGELIPAFTTSVQRTVWDLRLPAGDEVECVIDQGSIDTDRKKAQVSELELELKSGDPGHLFDLALQLQNDVPMQIGNLSKADRGYGLVAAKPSSVFKATPIRLSTKMTVEQAFRTIVLSCLEQIQANQPGLTANKDTESLHQMRVGLRRLQSALAIFKKCMPCPASIQDELHWLNSELGSARDWDVLLHSTLPNLQTVASIAGIVQPVQDAVQEKVARIYEDVAAIVASPRYTKLILTFFSWVQAASWHIGQQQHECALWSKPIGAFADKVLKRDRRRLLQRGRWLKQSDAQTRHQVRIAAKRARYASEFFESIYPKKTVRHYIKSLTELQDQLGLLNDASVTNGLLRELEASRPELRVEAAYILGYLACRFDQGAPSLLTDWRDFKAVVPLEIKEI